ncbi:hypothetical protein OAR30_03195 [Euryarchaeota archaeon]|nr:hypothetical protein [Euryarchaeota archaeon]
MGHWGDLSECLHLEQYLLDCIESLQPAGDDEGRRKRAMQRSSSSWELLNKNWKALALLAAEKTAPKAIDKDDLENSNSGNRNRRNRIGRRGGRQIKRSFEDYLLSPKEVLESKNSAAFKLAVLIAQKHKMNSWEATFEDEMNLLRIECNQGIHPVWSRLAREAPIFAELERFDINEDEDFSEDSSEWIKASNLDPRNNISIQKMVRNGFAFPTNLFSSTFTGKNSQRFSRETKTGILASNNER